MSSGTTLVYAILAGLLPSIIWIFFWLREDAMHPEPKWLIFATFLGGIGAVIAAIFAEKFAADLISNESTKYAVWAAIEEILKFIAVGVIALVSSQNDEPIDAMVYCIITALGFAAIENMLFLWQPLSNNEVANSLMTIDMRFLGATLVHVVSSAMVGFALGEAFYRGYVAKAIAVILGLSAAVALHAAFNLSIIYADAGNTLQIFAWIWVAVVLLIVFFEEVKAVRPKFQLKINTNQVNS